MGKKAAVANKMASVLTNALMAQVEKIFKGSAISYTVERRNEHLWWCDLTCYQGISIPRVLVQISISLTDYVAGIVFLGHSVTSVQIKQLRSLEEFSEKERIARFKQMCELERIQYVIRFDCEKISAQVRRELKEKSQIGGFKTKIWYDYKKFFNAAVMRGNENVFDIAHALEENNCKICASFIFPNRYSVEFRFLCAEYEDFLNAVDDFLQKLSHCESLSIAKINALVESSALKAFWVITKRVIHSWKKEAGGTIPFERLHYKLKEGLFEGDDTIERVVLPEGIKEIPDALFMDCVHLRFVRLPESVEVIGDEAFLGCEQLREVILSPNLKEIGREAFAFCESLLPVQLPESCKKIGYNAFCGAASEHHSYFYEDDNFYFDS